MPTVKTYVEGQIQPTDDGEGFQLVVTISGSNTNHYWTSRPARLNATTHEEAKDKAKEQVKALLKALNEDGS